VIQEGKPPDADVAYYVGTHSDGPVLYRTTTDPTDTYPVFGRHELDQRDPVLWQVVVGVLTQDRRTVERVAMALADSVVSGQWPHLNDYLRDVFRTQARAALASVMPVRCAECGRVIPADEALAGFEVCEHCPLPDSGTEVAR
jgi:hypothetical protein